jgi:cell division protein ZapA (FtsZ GTPase activity inhibitor)
VIIVSSLNRKVNPMNNKLVSVDTKMAMETIMRGFVVFNELIELQIGQVDFKSDKAERFDYLENEFDLAMGEMTDTMRKNRPEDLTVHGCLAILLDMKKVVEINKQVADLLEFEIFNNGYQKICEAVELVTDLIFHLESPEL